MADQDSKPVGNGNSGTNKVSVILAAIGLISTLGVAYIGYLGLTAPVRESIKATQTAEIRIATQTVEAHATSLAFEATLSAVPDTATPMPTPTDTLTPIPPTDTATPSPTNTPTPIPPTDTVTATPSPTDTATPRPTNTLTPTPIIIDSLESTNKWDSYIDRKGSSLILRSTSGVQGDALELSFDLKGDGYVGISKVIDPELLFGLDGIEFFYKGSGAPNTIEFKFLYEPGVAGTSTIFSVEWPQSSATSGWQSLEIPFYDLECWAETGCSANEKIDLQKVWQIDFAISSRRMSGDSEGVGIVVLDEIQGLKLP